MHNFLADNRDELIARCMANVVRRPSRAESEEQLRKGVPLFLAQLQRTLLAKEDGQAGDFLTTSGGSGGEAQALSQVGVTAAVHGNQLWDLGFSLDQVVHGYGDLCQATTDLAVEQDAPFNIDDFRRLHICLDSAIADAVTEFSIQRDASIARTQSAEVNERLGLLVHELRDSLGTATLAIRALETGNLALSGSTGGVLKRSQAALKTLVDHALDEVRVVTAASAPSEPFSLAMFLADAASQAALDASERGCTLTVRDVAPLLAIAGNRDRLLAALGSLLQNAFKFTHPHIGVMLMAYTHANRVFIEVQDHCGGIPPSSVEKMFIPFSAQHNDDKTGLGLGLAIARQSVEADGGTLTVRNLAGAGCVFTISLPRRELH
jgi:signal transduction histidine kinase